MHNQMRFSLTSVSSLRLKLRKRRLSEESGKFFHEHPTFKHLGAEKLRHKNTLELKFKILKYITTTL